MKLSSGLVRKPAEAVIKDIRRAKRRQFSSEEKIRIVLEGLRGEDSIADLCRREGIASSMYYGWSNEFLDAGKKRLAGDTARAATADEVKDLRLGASALKEVVADLVLENRLLKKKHERGWERRGMRYPAPEKLEVTRLVEQSLAGARHPGQAQRHPSHVLPLVRRLPVRRPRGSGRSPLATKPGVEPPAHGGSRADRRTHAGRAVTQPARAGGTLHRRAAVLRLQSHRLPPTQSSGSGHQPGLYRRQRRR
ncbi:hypothetical protein LPLAFNJD_LOCUS579 [Methylorubrum aminovorans]